VVSGNEQRQSRFVAGDEGLEKILPFGGCGSILEVFLLPS
jgi:hypothetical protein